MDVFVVVCNQEIVEDGKAITEPVVLDYLGWFRDSAQAEQKADELNKKHGDFDAEYFEKYGVNPFGYIQLMESK